MNQSNDRQSIAPIPFELRLAYNHEETAAMLGVSEQTIRGLTRDGLLLPCKVGAHHRFTKQSIVEFLEGARIDRS